MSTAPLFPLLIVGQGRAGRALCEALGRSGAGEIVAWSRGQGHRPLARALETARTIIVAVSDTAIESALEEHLLPAWPQGDAHPALALHLAGAWPSDRLAALATRGVALGVFHPVTALSGEESAGAFSGASVTISGDAPALAACRELAALLGMRASEVEDARRPLLHLGAVMAAGDLVALLHLAEEIVCAAGLEPPVARSLVAELGRSALEGYARRGAADAITGPVPRADLETLAQHADAARGAGLDSLPREAHALLANAGAILLEREGRLDPAAARAIRALVAGLASPRYNP